MHKHDRCRDPSHGRLRSSHYTTDSKQLKENERDDLFDVIKANNEYIGWNVRILTPQDISGGMLRRCASLVLLLICFSCRQSAPRTYGHARNLALGPMTFFGKRVSDFLMMIHY